MSNSHGNDRVLFRSCVFDDFKVSKYWRKGLSNIIKGKKQGKKTDGSEMKILRNIKKT